MFLRSTRGLSSRLFESEAARRVLPGLGLHVDVGPDDRFGAAPRLHAGDHRDHGRLRLPERRRAEPDQRAVSSGSPRAGQSAWARGSRACIVRNGRAAAVVLDDGTEIAARRAILADTSPAALLLAMVDEREVPGWVRAFMKRFPAGWGTFKVDWALSGPVPWQVEAARESAVVHAGGERRRSRRGSRARCAPAGCPSGLTW